MPTVAALVWGNYGRLVSNGSVAAVIIISVVAINVGLIIGSRMWAVPLATDISRLWIDPNSDVAANNELIRVYGNKIENGLNELVTLSNADGSNMATAAGMTRWAAYMDAVLDTVVYDEITNSTYTMLDICNGRSGQTAYTFGCSMTNPIDYFAQGGKFFPADAAAQWLLDTRLAYPAVNPTTGTCLSTTCQTILWGWALQTDLAASSVQRAGIYTGWFSNACLTSSKVLCQPASNLLTKVDDLISRPLFPPPAKFQFSWIKAQLVLGGIIQGAQLNGAPSTCNVTGNPFNMQTTTTTDAITFAPALLAAINAAKKAGTTVNLANGQTYSMANCGISFAPPGACTSPPTFCPPNVLSLVSPMDFSSPCASCIIATMWWMGELNFIQTGIQPVADPSSGILTLPGLRIWNTSSIATGRATSAGIAQQAATGAAALGAATFCNETHPTNNIKPSTCVTLFDGFYTATVAGLTGNVPGALATIPGRVAALVSNTNLDPLAELKSVFGGSKDLLDASFRDLMVRTSAIPDLAGVLRRHSSRANFSTPGVDIAEVLSGFKNDLATQNLRPAIFGGASPSAREIKSGRCTCNSGFSGLNCNRPTDLICDCDSTLRPTCIAGLLSSCTQMATCAGYTAIISLVAGASQLGINPSAVSAFQNFANDILVGSAFAVPTSAPTAISLLQTHCAGFIFCVDGYNVAADPFLNTSVPSSYFGVAANAVWNANVLSDLALNATADVTTKNRGFVLLLSCLAAGQATCEAVTSSVRTLLDVPSLPAPAALGPCSVAGTNAAGCFNTPAGSSSSWSDSAVQTAVTDPATGCANTAAFFNANQPAGDVITFGILFSCLAEMVQRPISSLVRLPSAIQAHPFVPPGSTAAKDLRCSSASRYLGTGVSNTTCIRAWSSFIWLGMDRALNSVPSAFVPAVVPVALTAFGATSNSTRATAKQQAAMPQLLAGLLATNPLFVQNISQSVFGGCTNYATCPLYRGTVDAVLAGSCAAASAPPLFEPVALDAQGCSALLTNLVGALTRVPSNLNAVSRALAKFKFMGTIFGSCGPTGVQNGGGECWANGDCGNGVCANLSSKVTLQNVTTLAFILQTNEPEGTVSFMRRFDTRYRALANKPIIDRYVAKLASQTGRRLETIQLGNPNGNASLTLEDAARIITNWRREMARNVKNFRDASASTANANVYTADSAEDLLNDISEADTAILVLGYGLMLLYTFLSCTNWSTDVQAMMNGSRALVGQAGIILVAISVASGLGVSHLLKVEWSAAATQIVPFVMLGLGVSDTFVMLRIWPYYQDGVSAADAAAKALTIAGPPMLLVSATNAGVFAVGVLTAMPVVVNFALQAVIVVIANYFTTNLALPALLVMDYKRMAAGRADMLPCIKVGTSARAQVSAQDTGYEENVFNRWCTPYYASCLLSIPGKLFVLAWSAAFLGSAIYGVERYAELGLQLSDIAPVGSELANALITRDSQFGFYTVGVVTSNADWSLREVQQGIVKVFNDVMASDYVVDASGTPWMQVFMSWGQVDTPLYSTTAAGEICSPTSSRTSGNCGKIFNCTVVTADDSVVNGSIPFYPRADFKRCLSLWVQTDIGYEAIKPSFPLVDAFAPRSSRVIDFTPSSDPLAAFLPFTRGTLFAQNLRVNADFVQLINELRAVANNQTTPPSFPIGEPIDFWDQYVSLRQIINTAVGYGLLICFLTIWFLLLCLVEGDAGILKRIFATFWASALTTGIIALTVYEIYGYMAFGGLKISAIPAISIIMSTGVAVEYTAYIAVAFVNGTGSLNDRARHSLMLMLAPVIDGAVTMFLGVVMLAASPFLFIVKYFFYPWLLIIFFGMFNGIAFLPVLFSFVGPPAVMSGASKTEALSVKQ